MRDGVYNIFVSDCTPWMGRFSHMFHVAHGIGITHCFRPWRYFIISAPHSDRLAFPYPGMSSSTTFDSPPFVPPIPNAFISLVRPGFDDVQQISWPIIAFSSELLPTFDRPKNATSGSTDANGVVRNLAADQSFSGE